MLPSGIGRQSSGVGNPDFSPGVEGKFVPIHVLMACRGVEVWFHSFLTAALDEVCGQHHATAALLPGKKLVPFGLASEPGGLG